MRKNTYFKYKIYFLKTEFSVFDEVISVSLILKLIFIEFFFSITYNFFLSLCDQNCGVQLADRQTHGQIDRKVKTEERKTLSNDIFNFKTVIISGTIMHVKFVIRGEGGG